MSGLFDDEPAPSGIALCDSHDLQDGGRAVGFDVIFGGQTCTAFAVRYRGKPVAYLNRCAHVAVELDIEPGRVFDDSGHWLLCQFHGAAYDPGSGRCEHGPCRGGLVKIQLSESGGVVRWHTAFNLKPVEF